MRHMSSGRKLSRSSSHRTALARAQATALFRHGRIKTTIAKAKNLRPYVEKLITTAKGGDLHARRLAAALPVAAGRAITACYDPLPAETHATIYHPAALRGFRRVLQPLAKPPLK